MQKNENNSANKQIINKILNNIQQLSTDFSSDFVLFSDSRYSPVCFSENNFFSLQLNQQKEQQIQNILSTKIAFIDGGNAELLKAPNFSLHFVRVYATIYQNNKRVSTLKHEFYSFTKTINKDNSLFYETTLVPFQDVSESQQTFFKTLIIQPIIVNSLDKNLTTGSHRADVSKIADIVRRIAEIKLAESLFNSVESVVLDGDLKPNQEIELAHFSRFFQMADKTCVMLAALSKSSTLLTNNGNSVVALLTSLAPFPSWYYYPVTQNNNPFHPVDIFFAKLHEKSEHVFKLEVFNQNKPNVGQLMSILLQNSKDPVFFGYPYCLIEADNFARVSNQEADYLKTKLITTSGTAFRQLMPYITALNAHDILDNIK